jgi:hypothetical protein
LEPIAAELTALVGKEAQSNFVSIGVFAPSLWEYKLPSYPMSAEVAIGPQQFSLSYQREPEPAEVVSLYGMGLTRTGRDIFSLIHTVPDDRYLDLLKRGLNVAKVIIRPV